MKLRDVYWYAKDSGAIEVSVLEPKINILNITNGLISLNHELWVLPGNFCLLNIFVKEIFGYCQNIPNLPIDHRLPLKLLWAILLNIYFRRRWCFQHQGQWKQNITFEVLMCTYQRKAVIFRSYHMQQMIHMYSLWHMYLGANNSVLQICMLSDLCRNRLLIVSLVAFVLVLECRDFSL